jgi:hypothetical protein
MMQELGRELWAFVKMQQRHGYKLVIKDTTLITIKIQEGLQFARMSARKYVYT